ncbi:MAG: YbjN domain-containing protein [Pseudomonadota bacterium]
MGKLISTTVRNTALKAIACGVALCGAMTTAHAQNSQQRTLANARLLVDNFDAQNLGPVLTELGIVWQVRQADNGTTFIVANFGGQLAVNFIPSACLNSGASNCVGLNTVAFFNNAAPNPQTVAAFNQKYAFVSAGVTSDQSGAYVSRYDIADYGIPRGNIESSLRNFMALALRFQDELSSARRTVSLDGYAEDLSASLLNGRGLNALGVDTAPKTLLQHHLSEFEEAPEIVRVMYADPNSGKNKITNVNVTNKK